MALPMVELNGEVMLVTEKRIEERGLVSPAWQIRTKNSTCDLTIGEIFPMGLRPRDWVKGTREFTLKPGHMVSVVTAQKLTLPDNVTGLATLVTSLTQKGILCLNVGVVDPGYDGPLSAMLVNFSSVEREITVDQRLFRVLFFEHAKVKNLEKFTQHPVTYSCAIDARSRHQFSETFLNVQGVINLARKEAWKVVGVSILLNWLPILALFAGVAGAVFGGLAYFNPS